MWNLPSKGTINDHSWGHNKHAKKITRTSVQSKKRLPVKSVDELGVFLVRPT